MATSVKESGYLAWLGAALLEQRGVVRELLRRLTCFGTPGNMKSSVFAKFVKMLEQVAVEKEVENDIISRIQEMESRHRVERQRRNLRTAAPARRKPRGIVQPVCAPQPERESDTMWWMLAGIAALMSSHHMKPRE